MKKVLCLIAAMILITISVITVRAEDTDLTEEVPSDTEEIVTISEEEISEAMSEAESVLPPEVYDKIKGYVDAAAYAMQNSESKGLVKVGDWVSEHEVTILGIGIPVVCLALAIILILSAYKVKVPVTTATNNAVAAVEKAKEYIDGSCDSVQEKMENLKDKCVETIQNLEEKHNEDVKELQEAYQGKLTAAEKAIEEIANKYDAQVEGFQEEVNKIARALLRFIEETEIPTRSMDEIREILNEGTEDETETNNEG